MGVIGVILVFVAIVQLGMLIVKGKRIEKEENILKINELFGYLDNNQLNLVDPTGKNIMMIAASSHFFNKENEKSFKDVLKVCVDKGMDINKVNQIDGKTALQYAIEGKFNDDVVELLLESGANPNICNNKGENHLFYAVKVGKDKYDLVVNKINDLNYQKEDGMSILMFAVQNMYTDIINDLLQRGADPKLMNKEGLNSSDIAKKYGPNLRIHLTYSNTEEGTHHDPTKTDEKNAKIRNHEIDEMIKKLDCLVNDKEYKAKKLKMHGIF